MYEVPTLVAKVAKLKGMYVRTCTDNFNQDRNFILGKNDTGEGEHISYHKDIESIKYALDMKETVLIRDNKGKVTGEKEIDHTFEEIKKQYEKECNFEKEFIAEELERERKRFEE